MTDKIKVEVYNTAVYAISGEFTLVDLKQLVMKIEELETRSRTALEKAMRPL